MELIHCVGSAQRDHPTAYIPTEVMVCFQGFVSNVFLKLYLFHIFSIYSFFVVAGMVGNGILGYIGFVWMSTIHEH